VTKNYSDFEALRPQLLALARSVLAGVRARLEPEDLVQTVLAEIYSKLQQGAEIRNPRAYANMAVKNRALDEMRRFHNKYERAWPRGAEESQPWEPLDPSAADAEIDPEMREVLSRLSPEERCFLWRVVFEERAVHDAQRLCGWPPRSPYFHYRKLLDRIRPLMGVGRDPEDDE
jgi:DNA-directed RNA polymerase specialized sigma24 family protein